MGGLSKQHTTEAQEALSDNPEERAFMVVDTYRSSYESICCSIDETQAAIGAEESRLAEQQEQEYKLQLEYQRLTTHPIMQADRDLRQLQGKLDNCRLTFKQLTHEEFYSDKAKERQQFIGEIQKDIDQQRKAIFNLQRQQQVGDELIRQQIKTMNRCIDVVTKLKDLDYLIRLYSHQMDEIKRKYKYTPQKMQDHEQQLQATKQQLRQLKQKPRHVRASIHNLKTALKALKKIKSKYEGEELYAYYDYIEKQIPSHWWVKLIEQLQKILQHLGFNRSTAEATEPSSREWLEARKRQCLSLTEDSLIRLPETSEVCKLGSDETKAEGYDPQVDKARQLLVSAQTVGLSLKR